MTGNLLPPRRAGILTVLSRTDNNWKQDLQGDFREHGISVRKRSPMFKPARSNLPTVLKVSRNVIRNRMYYGGPGARGHKNISGELNQPPEI